MIKVLPVSKAEVFPYNVKKNLKLREKKEGDAPKEPLKAKKSKIKFVSVDLNSRKRRKKTDGAKGKPALLPSKIPPEEPKVMKKDKYTDISKIILGNLENALEKAKRKEKKKKPVEEKKNPPPLKKLLLGKTEDEKNMISKKIKNILKAPHDIKFVDEDAKKVSKKKIKKSVSAKKILKDEEMKVKRALSEEKLLKRFVKNGMTLPSDKAERKKIIDRLWQTKRSLWKKRAQIMKQLEETSRAELREVNEQGDQPVVKTYVVPETVKAKGKNNIESVVYFDAKEKTIRPPSQDDFSKLAKPKIKSNDKKLNNSKANKEVLMKELKANKEIFKEQKEKKKKKVKAKVKAQKAENTEEKKEIEKPHLPERTYKKMVKDVANFIKKEEKKIINDLHEKIKSENLEQKEDKHEISENVQNSVCQTEKSLKSVKPNLKAKEVKRPRKVISRAASRSRNVSKTKLKPQLQKKAEVKEKNLKAKEEPEAVEKSVEIVREPPKIVKKQNAQSQVEMEKMLQRKAAFAQRLRVQMEQNKRVFVEMTKKKDPSKLRVLSRNDDTDISLSAPLSYN